MSYKVIQKMKTTLGKTQNVPHRGKKPETRLPKIRTITEIDLEKKQFTLM